MADRPILPSRLRREGASELAKRLVGKEFGSKRRKRLDRLLYS